MRTTMRRVRRMLSARERQRYGTVKLTVRPEAETEVNGEDEGEQIWTSQKRLMTVDEN